MKRIFEIVYLDGSKVPIDTIMHESGLNRYGCGLSCIAIDDFGDIHVIDKCDNSAEIDNEKYKISWAKGTRT